MLAALIHYKYLALFPLAAFEGPVLSLLVGFLVHAGYLAFLPSYGILLLGDLIPDTTYYYIGRFGNQKDFIKKYGSKVKIITEHFPTVEKLWQHHPFKTMFLSKLAYGLSTPFLVSAGLVKIPLRKFVANAFPITIFQYAVFMSIGYSLGKSYAAAEKYIKYTGIGIALIVIILIVVYILLSRYARKRILAMEVREDEDEKIPLQ